VVSRVVEVVVGGVVVDGLAVVGVVIDERRRDGGLVAVDGSVVGGVNGSVWPYLECAWSIPVSLQYR